MKISMDKKYKTIDGHNVTILTTTSRAYPDKPILGLIHYENHDLISSWTEEGYALSINQGLECEKAYGHDLVEIIEPIVRYANVYKKGKNEIRLGGVYSTKEEAEKRIPKVDKYAHIRIAKLVEVMEE